MFGSYVFTGILGAVLGAGVGIAWARITRCGPGTCPLAAKLWLPALIGAVFGMWIATSSGAPSEPAAVDESPSRGNPADDAKGTKQVITHIQSAEQFAKDVLAADKPVLVEFYATWCPPCKFLAPIMEEVAQELAGRAAVVKIDTDKLGQIAGEYGIQAIPTVILFKSGKPVERLVGVRAKGDYLAGVKRSLDAGT